MKAFTDPRHASRKMAMASLFCWLFTEPTFQETTNMSKELFQSKEENPFANQTYSDSNIDLDLMNFVIAGVKENIDRIDLIIVECAPEWPIDKIAKIDLVILRIAVFEVVYGKKAPVKVAIDEAVELAKEYGSDTSQKFVNGVLGTVVEKYVK